jgi:ATP-dependent helicase/nuclease subunit A
MVIYDLRFTIYDCNSISAHEMEPSPQAKNSLTPSQRQAVAARGNVLVMAGAGAGKTHTLVERCLDCIGNERAALDEILVVTFTEAAAAEMKQRLRSVLEEKSRETPGDSHWSEQLALFDAAHIGTLHGFCLKLVREHFYELGLDPQPVVLDEGEARLLADETLEEVLQEQYEGQDGLAASVQSLIQTYGGSRDEKIRSLVLRLHHYAQTRPDADGWLAGQIGKFSASEPTDWQAWLSAAIQDWRDEWLPVLTNLGAPISRSAGGLPKNEQAEQEFGVPSNNEKAVELLGMLQSLKRDFSRELAAEVLEQVVSSDGNWPAKRKGVLRKPLENLFDEAKFLASVAPVKSGSDPLAEDWNWVRGHMTALLRLAQNFAARFATRKRDEGVLDFHDLEQFALKLLWNFASDKPKPTAERWREKLRFIFVDEYQDINAAQDKIIRALSRDDAEANRFLVGDVKQSIYGFRLADPKIFHDYAGTWHGKNGKTIPLAENFRSRESILNFINSLFKPLMREEIGGVNYDDEAKLKFGSPETRSALSTTINPAPRAELLLRLKMKPNEVSDDKIGDGLDLEESAKEARSVAFCLNRLEKSGHKIWDDKRGAFRTVKLGDMAVLLRSPAGKAEIFAKEFERAGVKLSVARGGFYDTSEVLDLLSLLQLLDNPLQDVPGIAVLRSPLVGCSLDELAEIRLVAGGHFWFALNQVQNPRPKVQSQTRAKVGKFLERFHRWRKLARQVSLSQCLEEVLAETHYADWLQSRPRGAQRRANVEQFLNLAQRFDQFQRQGLFRFLKFIEAQRETGAEPEVAPAADDNAVRLMSIHQSKGLEFPVVVVADLAKTFNEQDLRGEIILDEEFGLCPRVQPPQTGARYPSLPHWLAQRRQRAGLRGEELRLLYVAMTRARDTLILSGGISQNKWDELWTKPVAVTPRSILSAKSFADWLGLWFADQVQSPKSEVQSGSEGELPDLRWRLVADAKLGGDSARSSRGDEAQTETISEPPHVGCHEYDGAAEKVRARLEWNYPFKAATKRKAKSSVTELRRTAEESDEEAEQVFHPHRFSTKRLREKLSAAEAGAAHHQFLQHVRLEKTGDRATLAMEAQRLEQENILSAEERAVLDLEAVADFWDSLPGRRIRAQPPDSVKRELPFTAKFSPAELAEITGAKAEAGLENEFVVVQGVADLAVLLPEEIWLVDFKTDKVRADELPEKTKLYEPQLKLYARALAKIYSRPVTHGWLHFLDVRKTVDVKI